MNVELPSFKNGEHNSKKGVTLYHALTPVIANINENYNIVVAIYVSACQMLWSSSHHNQLVRSQD